ncbi:MAG: DNA-3-methyladenine glycosylase [Gemmatimonadaceae bacterium]
MKENAALTARRSRIGKVLPASFYGRDTERVSRELLGCVLECTTADGKASGMIVETEAYIGEHDPACHAAAGRTRRTDPLYGRPGIAYVYFIYGMYWCVNAVTRAEGLPSAVLIRAVEPLMGIELMRARRGPARSDRELTDGPGKLCIALGIGRKNNGAGLQRGPLVIREAERVAERDVVVASRIGIKKAADWPLRWYIRNNDFVSRR